MAEEEGPGAQLTPVPDPEEPGPPELMEIKVSWKAEDDSMSISYRGMKPWRLWAAAKMLEMLGDQMFVQNQAQQMQEQVRRQEMIQALRSGGGQFGPLKTE